MKRAAILGATGLVGSYLLQELLAHSEIDEVVSIGRKPLEQDHPKLKEHNGDLLEDDFWNFDQAVDLVFVCIGTTKSKTPDPQKYRAIDYGIPLQAGQWAERNGAKLISAVSSVGAKASSGNFYLKTKGEMEEALEGLGISSQIIRPSMILGPRQESRWGESFAKGIMSFLKPLMPKNYRPVEAQDIAKAMLQVALTRQESLVVESAQLEDLAEGL